MQSITLESLKRTRWGARSSLALLLTSLLGDACAAEPAANSGSAGSIASPATAGTNSAGSGATTTATGTPATSSAGSSGGPAASGSGAATGKLSFATDVYGPVIRARCASCHTDAPSFGGLTFLPDAAAAYANLVNVPAGAADANQCKASGLARVQPGAPEQSLLYTKLTKPVCGSQMPPAVFPQPTPAQVEIVRKWIADGAAP
jgi:hypothetical protein